MKRSRRTALVACAAIMVPIVVTVGGVTAATRLFSDPAPEPTAAESSVVSSGAVLPVDSQRPVLNAFAAPLQTQSQTVSDVRFDTDFGEADIVSASMSATPAGVITASVTVDQYSPPSSDLWQFGSTTVTWFIDGDGDGIASGSVRIDGADGALRGGVLGRNQRVRCLGDATSNASTRTYSVSFSAACIGNPETFRFWTELELDDVTFDVSDEDRGPASGWSPAVQNPAFVDALVTVQPFRYFDSRDSGEPRSPRSVTEVDVTGLGGVPDDALAVLLNVTAVRPADNGFVTVTPCGFERAETSNLNYRSGETIANAALARVGVDGKVCFYTEKEIHLVVDVNGYVPALSDVGSIPPVRLLDTRQLGSPVEAGGVVEVSVADRGGVPDDAAGVVLNVTAVRPAGRGFMTVYACDADRPTASNLNVRSNVNVPNAVVAAVSDEGTVCVYTSVEAHVLVDVNGYLPQATGVSPITPERILDTRELGDVVAAGSVTVVPVLDRAGVPGDASGVILNVTAVRPSSRGYLTVFPCGTDVPLASNLNFLPDTNVPNAVVARVGQNGSICIFNSAPAHLLVDVNGFVS